MDYFIGIDAGGTKTKATAYSPAGAVLGSTTTPMGNPTVDYESATGNILLAIQSLKSTLPGSCLRLTIGAAGIETGNFKSLWHQEFQGHAPELTLLNDAELALTAAHKGSNGILLIAGTGSICYCRVDSRLLRVGGWGHLINDEGGGCSIGLSAIRAITDAFDRGQPETPLKQLIFTHLNITRLPDLIAFTYQSEKSGWASLVLPLTALAESGDPEALSILHTAAAQLAAKVTQIAARANLTAPPIACSGSVLLRVPPLRQKFFQLLSTALPGYTLVEDFEPTKAVLYSSSTKKGCSL